MQLKTRLIFIAAIALSAFLYSCTYTQKYSPQLNEKQTIVFDSLKTKLAFESINLIGEKKSGSGGDQTLLTVKVINGKDIPADSAQMTKLAKTIGQLVRTALKNPNEFGFYDVIFDTRTVDGNTTNDNFIGHEFRLSEL